MQPIPAEPEIVQDRVVALRPFTPDDIDALVRVFSDDESARWNPGPSDREGIEAWLARRNDWTSGVHASWAVGDASGHLLGSVSLHRVDLEQEDAEIGYLVAPWARRRGVGRCAVMAATRYAFDRLAMHRLYLYHAVENTASCRLALGAGYRLEGELRQSHRYGDGLRHDEHLHARLAADG